MSNQCNQWSRRAFHSSLLAGSAGLLVASMGRWSLAATWEKIDEDQGIKVFRKDMSGTALHAFRGTGVVDASLEKVIWVLADNDHRTDWVDRLERSLVLERKSKYEFIVYQHFSSPAVIADRDFVYHARAFSRADGSAVLEIASTTHPQAPATVGVRGWLQSSSYVLKPLSKTKTLVEVEIALDPKGALPKWIVNLVQKSWPMNTLLGLRKQVQKPYVGTLAPPPIG